MDGHMTGYCQSTKQQNDQNEILESPGLIAKRDRNHKKFWSAVWQLRRWPVTFFLGGTLPPRLRTWSPSSIACKG